jgi:hypothetical protein
MANKSRDVVSKSGRIPSIDFWRGAFLLMIYVNHVPDNLLAKLTLRNWGFADSAEAFVFISGFSAMLAFGRHFEFGGLGVGILRTLKRAWQLFCAHVLLVFALSAILVLAGDFTDSRPIMEQLNFSPFFVETEVAIVKLLRLGYMPNLTDILPLYIVLILLFPLAWSLIRISSVLALLLSLGVWFWVNATGQSFANHPEGAIWFFNPMAWQFLFVAGMVARHERQRLSKLVASKTTYALSWLIVGGSLIAVAPWTHFEAFSSWRLVPSSFLGIDNKTNLAWVRIVHFLALACIAARLLPNSSSFWKNRAVAATSLCGRHSLAIYCTGSALSLIAHVVLRICKANEFGSGLIVLSGVFLLVMLAALIQKMKTLLKDAETHGFQPDDRHQSPSPCAALETSSV